MKIVIRADASLTMGSGHVMRCLTLATALAEQGHHIYFICREQAGHLAARIKQHGFEVVLLPSITHLDAMLPQTYAHGGWLGMTEQEDFTDCQSVLAQLQPDWLIIDHYGIAKPWQMLAKVMLPTVKLLVIDDLADRQHLADILLDQNLGRQTSNYVRYAPSSCRLLLGTRYTLLRDEFCEWRTKSLARRKQIAQQINRTWQILVNLGGVDNNNITLTLLQSLQKFFDNNPSQLGKVTVVMGATAPHIDSVKNFVQTVSYHCEVIVNASNMAELMSEADIAIGAAGSTTWERCCLGLPMVLLVLADNQRVIADALEQQQVAKIVNNLTKLDETLPKLLLALQKDYVRLSRKAAQLVDGQGVKRIVNHIDFVNHYPTSNIRPATTSDMKLVWQWRNHPDVRQWMFGQSKIALADHQAWFNRQLNNPNVTLLIFESKGEPTGFVNFTRSSIDKYAKLNQSSYQANSQSTAQKTASWGFYLAPESPKGQGLGFSLGILAIQALFNTTDIQKLTAQVLDYNKASLALHRRLGFVQTNVLKQHFGFGDKVYDVIEFELNRDGFLY